MRDKIPPPPRQFLACKHSLSLRIIPAALTLLFSSFGMAGETFTYDGSNPALVNTPSGIYLDVKGINTLLPAGSTSGNDIIIDYVTGEGTNPTYAMGGYGYSTSGVSLVENNRIGLKQGKVEKNLYGGYSYSASGTAITNYNTVTLSGGKVNGNVRGGSTRIATNGTGKATATYNTINLDGPVSFKDGVILYGGLEEEKGNPTFVDVFTGNTLNVRAVTACPGSPASSSSISTSPATSGTVERC
jgi:hypothetical protein